MAKNFNYELAIWENLRAVIETNANTELATIDSTLETFVRYDTPPQMATDFPIVYLDWEGAELSKSDDDGYCTQDHEFRAWVAILGTDWATLDYKTSKYLLAIHRCFDKTTAAIITDGVTATLSNVAWEVVERQNVGFSQNVNNGIYRRDAYLTLRIQFMEVATNV